MNSSRNKRGTRGGIREPEPFPPHTHTPPKKNHKASKIGPALLDNHKATQPTFNVGPLPAQQQHIEDDLPNKQERPRDLGRSPEND